VAGKGLVPGSGLQCAALTRQGRRCEREARRGDVTCEQHAGQSGSSVERARELLEQEAAGVVGTMLDLMDSGLPEDSTRLGAARVLFSRVVPEEKIVEHRVRVDPMVVWEGLEKLVAGRRELAESGLVDEGRFGVVDAESVEVAPVDRDWRADLEEGDERAG
jgi:hypothetical protein